MVWSDERRDSFISEIQSRVQDATISIFENRDISATWWYDLEELEEWLSDEFLCQMCSPQLSSLNQDTEEAGYNTAKFIDELLALPVEQRVKTIQDITVKPTFVTTRRSTDAVLHPNPFISRILHYINNNVTERVSVDDVVALVPMSRRLLESTFRREMGTSIYQYIIKVRVEKMKDLIVNGNPPLAAADMLNVDYKIIARSFKKLTGMTPGEFADTITV